MFLYLYGCVPFPVLRGLPVVTFLRFGLKGLVLLIGHFDDGVLGFLQLGALFGRPLPPPAYLRSPNTAVMPVRNAFQNHLSCTSLAVLPFINHRTLLIDWRPCKWWMVNGLHLYSALQYCLTFTRSPTHSHTYGGVWSSLGLGALLRNTLTLAS